MVGESLMVTLLIVWDASKEVALIVLRKEFSQRLLDSNRMETLRSNLVLDVLLISRHAARGNVPQ